MLTKDRPTIGEKIKTFAPWIKWLVKKEIEEYKATSAYIEMLCPGPRVRKVEDSPIKQLERLVKASIVKEFGSRIEHSRGFNLLVDTVMYKLQKEDLKTNEKHPDELPNN